MYSVSCTDENVTCINLYPCHINFFAEQTERIQVSNLLILVYIPSHTHARRSEDMTLQWN